MSDKRLEIHVAVETRLPPLAQKHVACVIGRREIEKIRTVKRDRCALIANRCYRDRIGFNEGLEIIRLRVFFATPERERA